MRAKATLAGTSTGTRVLRIGRFAVVLPAVLLLLAAVSHADESPGLGWPTVYEALQQYYEQNPSLADTPHSGWKPFNRIKWFQERRPGRDGGLPDPDARWTAWQRKRQLEVAASPAASSWFSLGPVNFAGRMLAIDFDPTNTSVVYVGAASGGVFKSTDGGTSWQAIADGIPSMAVGGLGVSRTDPQIVVIGTGEGTYNGDRVSGVGILRSTDAGATWVTTSLSFSPSQGHGFHVVTPGPDGSFLAGATDGLYRSVDDGANWTLLPGTATTNGWYDVQWDPQDSLRVYAVKGNDSSANGVYLSTDAGATWGLSGTGQPPDSTWGKAKLGVSGSTVYAYIGLQFSDTVFGLIRSTDDGATWTQPAASAIPDGQAWYNLSCVADPNNSQRVICGAVTLARSNDGGATFTQVGSNVHVDHHALKYEPGSNTRVWATCDGGVYFSAGDGSLLSWVDKNVGVITYQFYDICVNNGPDPYYVMGGTQDNGTDKWSGTTTWANGLGSDGMICNVDPTNGTTVYAEWQVGSHHKSTSSGGEFSWFQINTGITGTGWWVTPVAEAQSDGDILFTETSDGIFKTTDGGANWSNVEPTRAVSIAVSPADDDVVWTVGYTAQLFSTDGGGTWTSNPPPPFAIGYPTRIIAHPTDPLAAFVTLSGYSGVAKVVHTTNGGVTWLDATGDLPDIPANGIAIDPVFTDDWYLATDLGVWYSSNGGVNWTPFGSGLPNVVVEDVEIQATKRKLVAGSYGRGAWEIDLAPDPTAVAESEVPRPRDLMLDEPWPNPVRDHALLRYAARSDARVTLRLYDVAGRLVSQLDELPRGDGIIRNVTWLPDDVPSGVYLAVLQAGTERLTRKITVLR